MYAVLIPVVAMMIPIVAIAGGLTVAVVRTYGQQKIAELAMRERIAAIEKGLDPARLPPLPAVGDPEDLQRDARSPRERALATAQGLYIGAIITFASGLGLSFLLYVLSRGDGWAIGVLVMLVAVALGASGALVRRDAPPAGAESRTVRAG